MAGIWQAIRTGAWLTPSRLRAYSIILIAAYAAATILWIALADGLVDRNNKPIGTDFSNVYAAGTLTLEGKPDVAYRFVDHARYLDAWFDALGLSRDVVLVVHDWGSALGFHWARRHAERVKGVAYMEAIVRPVTWQEWPEAARKIFQAMRSPGGEKMVLQKNVFVERILPASVVRGLTDAEMDRYRAPYREAGESRRPTLTWPREIPVDGEPADVVGIVREYGEWLSKSPMPKLFVNAEPGSILVGAQREFCRSWPNQREVTVRGRHFIQEDSPDEIGRALSAFVR